MEALTSSDILREEIVTQSKAEAKAILELAEKEAAKIIKEAEKQAEKIINDLVQKAENSSEAIRRRILSGVHLEVKKIKLRSREVIIEQIIQELNKKLDAFRQDSAYQSVLETLIIEGVMAIDGSDLELECGDVENKLLTSQVLDKIVDSIQQQTERTVTLKLSGAIHEEGGVVIVEASGRTRFDNRFSARMRRSQDVLRLKIMNSIFENE